MNQKIYARIDDWRNRPIAGEHPYLFVDGIRRRTRMVGAFPDGHSAVMLAAARLRHVAGTDWGDRAYLNMELLREHDRERATRGESAVA